MSRPRVLRIGHLKFRILWGAKHVKAILPRGEEAGGAMSGTHLMIAIDPLHAEDTTRSVLIHEMLHAAFEANGYPLTYPDEELIVCALTGPILDAFRRNPTFAQYILEDDESD